jgi:hypothetical protein
MICNNSRSRKLPFLVFATLFGLFVLIPGLVNGQDTLQIANSSGTRGSNVTVAVNMANRTHAIGGIDMRIGYDTTVVKLTAVAATYRTQFFVDFPNVFDVDTSSRGYIRVLAFSWRGDAVVQGTGAIVTLSFTVKTTASFGASTIRFATVNQSDNQLSDASGNTIIPTLVNGTLTVGGSSNTVPTISVGSSSYEATVGSQLQFSVSASDATDSITLGATDLPIGSSFATVRGYRNAQSTFRFTAADSQVYHSYNVSFSANDGVNGATIQIVSINVVPSGGGGNHAPVIASIGSQSVTEGQHLAFSVSASDQDGDFVTITASGLPTHSSFPTATGDSIATGSFSFDPDFNQGGSVFSVIFTAQDALGSSSQTTVNISVLDMPNDLIKLAANQGALAGSTERSIIVNLTNAKPVYGLQFDFLFDPTIFTIRSANPGTRAQDMAFFSQLLDDDRYRIMIFSMGNETIAPGTDTIVNFSIDVDSRALFGPKSITFDSATTVQDSIGSSMALLFSPDTFTVDRLGDANLDGLITVGDCVAIVAGLLHRVTLRPRAMDAADFNRDAQVRISDLMLVVNHILGRTVLTPPLPLIAGNVELIRDGLTPGNRVLLPLWATLDNEAAGLQFAFEYDSTQVRFHGIERGSLVDGMRLDFQDFGNKVIGVIYDLDLSVFGPGTGEIIKLDMEAVSTNTDPKSAIRLTDFQLVDKDAQTLKIEIIGELPTSFTLQQNYPNPFNSNTIISFELPVSSAIKLSIYNVLGQNVNVLEDGYLEAGNHTVIWNGLDASGEQVSSGVYFYRLQAQNFNETKRMLLVK